MLRPIAFLTAFLATPLASAQVTSLKELCDGVNGMPTLISGDRFGEAIADIGDLNGDGHRDLVVGAIGDDDGGTDRGAVYVLFLDANGDVASFQKISSTSGGLSAPLADGDEFGRAVELLSDLDGAGGADCYIAVGAHRDPDGGIQRGAVYVLGLDTTGMVVREQKISDSAGGFTGPLEDRGRFGRAVAFMGDLDGAGPAVAAMAVGANQEGNTDDGAIYILYLDSSAMVLSWTRLTNGKGGIPQGTFQSNSHIGTSLDWRPGGSFAGHLLAGAPVDDDGGRDRGAVYVLTISDTGLNRGVVRKISSTSGGFNGPLADQQAFGQSVQWLQQATGSDCGGTIAVGAATIDGIAAVGDVWILGLNGNFTNVRAERLITEGSGELPPGTLISGDRFGRAIERVGDLPAVAGASIVVGAPFVDNVANEEGCLFQIGTREVLLSTDPNIVVTPAPLTLSSFGGSPGKFAHLFVMFFDGVFFPLRLFSKTFDADGYLELGAPGTPPALAGHNATFQVFALSQAGDVVESNPATVDFQ